MNEAFYYNALNIAKRSEYRALKNLREKFGSWKNAWDGISSYEKNGVDPQKEWEKIERADIRLVLTDESGYPEALKEIPWAPFGIYARGTIESCSALCIAVVGTRKATEEGKRFAKQISSELARQGCSIISGLAFGIDAAAHSGAIEAKGRTFAVLANGLDSVYPRTHERLAKTILENGGALISEYPYGSPSLPYRFIERNRIVSGLSRGILVIEAPKESGALATARFALDQNRDVFVVPGPAHHPNFSGSHGLIRSGAELVTSSEEILEALGIGPSTKQNIQLQFQIPEEEKIFALLQKHSAPLPIDKIIELTNLKANIVNQTLSFLLIKNLVQENNKGYFIS